METYLPTFFLTQENKPSVFGVERTTYLTCTQAWEGKCEINRSGASTTHSTIGVLETEW
jgi:hypothetical protein